MAYNSKEIWIPTDKSTAEIAASNSSPEMAVKSGGADVARGLIAHIHVRAEQTDASNSAVPVKIYDGSDKDTDNLIYSATFDLRAAPLQAFDSLGLPIPVFATPYVVIGDIQGGVASMEYSVIVYIKGLA